MLVPDTIEEGMSDGILNLYPSLIVYIQNPQEQILGFLVIVVTELKSIYIWISFFKLIFYIP